MTTTSFSYLLNVLKRVNFNLGMRENGFLKRKEANESCDKSCCLSSAVNYSTAGYYTSFLGFKADRSGFGLMNRSFPSRRVLSFAFCNWSNPSNWPKLNDSNSMPFLTSSGCFCCRKYPPAQKVNCHTSWSKVSQAPARFLRTISVCNSDSF